MGKKRTKAEQRPMQTTAKRGRPKREPGVIVHAEIERDVGTAFLRYHQSLELRPSIRSVIEAALREYLEKRGFWPLDHDDDN